MAKNIDEIISYTPAELRVGKETYVSLYAYDPLSNKLRRKRYKLNHIESSAERKRYGRELCARLNEQLRNGWNPFIETDSGKGYAKFEEAVTDWIRRQERLMKDGVTREATYVEYASKVRNLLKYNRNQCIPIVYIYQMDASFLNDFLDYIYIDRGNTAKTYNNYIRVISVMCKFFLARGYISTDPCAQIKSISRNRLPQKERNVISSADLRKIYEYLSEHNRHFLLACYLEYYCFVRPKELSMLLIGDISYKSRTILIRKEVAKNRKEEITTMPEVVIRMLIDLDIHAHPDNYYIFSDNFMPGRDRRSEKTFRDEWLKMRRKLKLPENYQFYSLKDSGVTDMLEKNIPAIAVRNQARHSSVSVTEIYTQRRERKANEEIAKFEGNF
ncbi:integrase [Porphyromonas phage phage019b_ATCC49417]|uniref:Tyrosine-type recombinase/integrase n=2 Tax=root TaxID=1 RepID=A0AAE9XH72_PORGN|nr:site-specific integrase [Porphyromonas gingivalis]WCG02205.1 tyrosine-type recombinase/integrase [Porphyromonas gingivalis]SJL32816.1 site-specific tyrosine recombinase XerC [Porphyromonas gingivalis]